ncbi:Transmembrane channel-like protein 3 [Galemys pyrenaicus]|uniref:Transmembrane channel-like protein 3 n=1 Tax=Galemys pyrenaicus TaxID=202257 RepID=A0A8J6ABQ7_GALPY|nr:Transmembrane channel-like protein 3 [Galemys pyrenaicus]
MTAALPRAALALAALSAARVQMQVDSASRPPRASPPASTRLSTPQSNGRALHFNAGGQSGQVETIAQPAPPAPWPGPSSPSAPLPGTCGPRREQPGTRWGRGRGGAPAAAVCRHPLRGAPPDTPAPRHPLPDTPQLGHTHLALRCPRGAGASTWDLRLDSPRGPWPALKSIEGVGSEPLFRKDFGQIDPPLHRRGAAGGQRASRPRCCAGSECDAHGRARPTCWPEGAFQPHGSRGVGGAPPRSAPRSTARAPHPQQAGPPGPSGEAVGWRPHAGSLGGPRAEEGPAPLAKSRAGSRACGRGRPGCTRGSRHPQKQRAEPEYTPALADSGPASATSSSDARGSSAGHCLPGGGRLQRAEGPGGRRRPPAGPRLEGLVCSRV